MRDKGAGSRAVPLCGREPTTRAAKKKDGATEGKKSRGSRVTASVPSPIAVGRARTRTPVVKKKGEAQGGARHERRVRSGDPSTGRSNARNKPARKKEGSTTESARRERKKKGKNKKGKMATCSGSSQDDECCPITLVPFRTITAARTTFLPCCHRFDSDAIRHYIDNCLARRAPRGATPPVPCPVCRCRVPPDYLADMGVPVAWPPAAPVVAVPVVAAPAVAAPAVRAANAVAAPATAARRSSRPSRPPAPVVIVISDGDDSEEAHERTAQWIDSDDDDDEDDDDDSTGSLDEFIVDDDETDPDAEYTPAPIVAAPRSGPAPDDDSDLDDDDSTDSDCSCLTDSEDI